MINLRYHIVSITAVFLAIGIGLTLGSTFLDRATVDNLQGRLEDLDGRLGEKDEQIDELQTALDEDRAVRDALDEQGAGLLEGILEEVPVAVVASRGVDEDEVRSAVQALQAAGADVEGLLWLTDRWTLDQAGEIDDLSIGLGEETDDPSRLRRMAINLLGDELAAAQEAPEEQPGDDLPAGDVPADDLPADDGGAAPEDPAADPGAQDPAVQDTTPDGTAVDEPVEAEPMPIDTLVALIEAGFVDFEAAPDGPEAPALVAGTRLVVVGGSDELPDDVVIEPLVGRIASLADGPVLGVAGSARPENGGLSDLVTVIRESEELREQVSTVDDLQHFGSWAAMVLALRDSADGIVGHYGVAEGASRLLPPMSSP